MLTKLTFFHVDPPQIRLPDNYDQAIDDIFKEEIGILTCI